MHRFFHELWRRIPPNALWLYAGSLAGGALNYFYNIVMARPAFLGPANFGALAALGALLYIEGIIVSTITTVTTNYSATLLGAGVSGHVREFIWRVSKYVLTGSVLLMIIFIGTSPLIARGLHLSSVTPVLILAPIMIVALLLSVLIGVLQGSHAFGILSLVTVGGALLRLVLAVLIVFYGHLGLNGALIGNLGSLVLIYLFVVLFLRYRYRATIGSASAAMPLSWRTLGGYSGYVFAMVLGLTSLFSVDIVLAQHYLTTAEASLYASLSTLGRIIYFTTFPITLMMFPIITKRLAAGQSYRRIVWVCGSLIATICGSLIIAYATVPASIIRLTVGVPYLTGARDLWLYAAFYSALSLATWLAHFLLARQRMVVAAIPSLCLFFQIFFIIRHHTFAHVIISNSLMAATLLLLGLAAVAIFSPTRQSR